MVQSGAKRINWVGLVTERTPDLIAAEREPVYAGILARDGGVALSVECLRANVHVLASRG